MYLILKSFKCMEWKHFLKLWRMIAWGLGAALLLLPLIAMQFTDQVVWTGFDFAFAATLIFGVLAIFELAVRKTANRAYRAGVIFALVVSFLLIWINAAVGIIDGAPGDETPANLMFFGVIGTAAIGALIARGNPRGMAYTMTFAAFMQIGVALIAAALGMQPLGGIFAITSVFGMLWLASAGLFRRSAL